MKEKKWLLGFLIFLIVIAGFLAILNNRESAYAQQAPAAEVTLEIASAKSVPLGWAITISLAQARFKLTNQEAAEKGILSIEFSNDAEILYANTNCENAVIEKESRSISVTKNNWKGDDACITGAVVRPSQSGPFTITARFAFSWQGVQGKAAPVSKTFDVYNPLETPTPTPTFTPVPTPTPVDLPPVINEPWEGQTFQVRRGQTIGLQIKAQDPEGKGVAYSLSQHPNGMEISGAGLVIWEVPDTGAFTEGQRVKIVIEVSDNTFQPWQGKTASRTFFIEIGAAPLPTPTFTPTPEPAPKPAPPTPVPPTPVPDKEPTLDFPPEGWSARIEVGKPWSIVAKGSDPEHQPVYFSLMQNKLNPFPPRIGINPQTGEFFWELTGTPSSSWDMRVCVSDRPEGYAESGGRGQCNIITLHVTNPSPGGALPEENSDNNAPVDLREIEELIQQIKEEAAKLTISTPQAGTHADIFSDYVYPYWKIDDTFTFKEPLQKGMYHQDVVNLQIVLNAGPDTLVSNEGDGSPGKETNFFGPKTFDAVCRFQEKYAKEILKSWGLAECNGFVGLETREKLNELLGEEKAKRDETNRPNSQKSTLFQISPPIVSIGDLNSGMVGVVDFYGKTSVDAFKTVPETIHWESYAYYTAVHPEFANSPFAKIVQFATGLSPQGDISSQDLFLNAALLPVSDLKVVGRAGITLFRGSGSWIIRVGEKPAIRIQGEAADIVAKKYARTLLKIANMDIATLRRVIKNPGDLLRLAKYIDEQGKAGLDLIEKAGKQIGVKTERFPDAINHFTDVAKGGRGHGADTGIPLLGRPFRDVDEYVEWAREVVKNPSSKRVLYYHQSKLDDPTLGYLLEKGGKVFLVAVDDAGNIKTFHYLKEGWGYVQEGFVWNKLFKIDPF